MLKAIFMKHIIFMGFSCEATNQRPLISKQMQAHYFIFYEVFDHIVSLSIVNFYNEGCDLNYLWFYVTQGSSEF